jgi:2,3,4,5-tetrahydropyridine-2-carboxylate N-succinyltransferase
VDLKVRVVPPATARYGSFMEAGVVLMPSYVNIGAYVGRGTMVDTWATVGSCAQVGANVHLSGGVGIGGVLEPASATPVVIEDGCFVGSRCIVVEGVRVGREAVLAANVTLTASTPIIDARTEDLREFKGVIPPRAVVVPGVKEKKVGQGRIMTSCAYIIGDRKPSTDLKTSLNQVLRDFSLSV